MDHQKDIMELIEYKDNNITSTIYKRNNVQEAENKLCHLYAPIRFDLHGVMDLLPANFPIKYPACIISYVGKHSPRREQARKEIKDRMKTNQIKFGILVFRRISDDEYDFHRRLVGTKAWINLYLSKCTRNKKVFFLDDSTDHINSTLKLNIPNLTTILVKDLDHLKEKIKEIYNILDNETQMSTKGNDQSRINNYYKYRKYKYKYFKLL